MEKEFLKKYSFVLASEYRKNTILSLEKKLKTPKQISLETKQNITHTSRALRELTGEELTKCVTPEKIKGRLYQLTGEGEKIVSYLKK